jgi:hypothetical protein
METCMTPTAIPKMLNIPRAVDDSCHPLRARSRAVGVLVMSGFGALWAALGLARAGAAGWAWCALAALVVAFGVSAVRVLREHPSLEGPLPDAVAAQRRRAGRIFAWTSAGEGVGILLAVNVAVNLGHPEWQAAAAMAVVGLHFLPLAVAFGYRPHLVSGAALTVWALSYPWVLSGGPMAPAGLLGAGVILFASAAWALRSIR